MGMQVNTNEMQMDYEWDTNKIPQILCFSFDNIFSFEKRKIQMNSNEIPQIPFSILILFSVIAIDRNTIWKDEISLWEDARKKSPSLVRPYNNLGEAYDKLGNYDQAIKEFKQALKINPNYFFGLNNL